MKPLMLFAAAPAAFLAIAFDELLPAIQRVPELIGSQDWVTLGVIVSLALLLLFDEVIAESGHPANNIKQFLVWIATSWLRSKGALPKSKNSNGEE